jgi:hypothetical protein
MTTAVAMPRLRKLVDARSLSGSLEVVNRQENYHACGQVVIPITQGLAS